jgi:hypothetical protein
MDWSIRSLQSGPDHPATVYRVTDGVTPLGSAPFFFGYH